MHVFIATLQSETDKSMIRAGFQLLIQRGTEKFVVLNHETYLLFQIFFSQFNTLDTFRKFLLFIQNKLYKNLK